MKKLILLSFLSISLFSCSDDDDGGGTAPINNTDYFPSSENASWNYDYSFESQGQSSDGQINVTVDGTTDIDGTTYQVIDNTFYLIGAMDQVYFKKNTNHEVTIRPMFDLTGNMLDLGELDLVKNNMSTGQLVDEGTSNMTSESIEIPSNDYNVSGTVTPYTTITVKNYYAANLAQMSINNQSFSDLNQHRLEYEIKVVLDIDASIEVAGASLPIDREHELVSNQQYGELDLWMAKDIGIVKTAFDYSFEDIEMTTEITFAGITLDILDLAPELGEFGEQLDTEGESEIIDYSL